MDVDEACRLSAFLRAQPQSSVTVNESKAGCWQTHNSKTRMTCGVCSNSGGMSFPIPCLSASGLSAIVQVRSSNSIHPPDFKSFSLKKKAQLSISQVCAPSIKQKSKQGSQ